jgi:hypothetical protein
MPLACLVAFASPVLANELEGEYRLSGTHDAAPNAPFNSEITVRESGGKLNVTRRVTLGDGSTSTRTGTVDPNNVTDTGFTVVLTGNGGIAALIGPGQAVPAGSVQLVFTVDGNGICEARTTDALGQAIANGERRIEELGGGANDLLVYTRGGLKTILGKGIKKVFESGVGVGETLKLTDFLHVGLELETELLEEGELLPIQRKVLEQQAEPHVWMQTDVEGGIRLPFNATIPVGGAGNFSVGFVPGAKLRYEVTELYKTPDGITDGKGIVRAIKEQGKHVYESTIKGRRIRDGRIVELPINADEALAMQVGAERVVEGEWSVAVSGSLGVGYDTTAVSDALEVGASARVGGFYRIRDWLRIETTRLPGNEIRVHLMDGRSKGPGATARAFVGASINTNEEEGGWEPSAEYLEPVVDLANDVVEDVLRFEIKGSKGKTEKRELDLSYRFDLTKAPAREAYERAVRGDFTRAAELFTNPANGVERDFRVVELEEKVYERAELEFSIFVDGKWTEDAEISEVFVQDSAGNNFHRVFRYQEQRKLGLGAIWTQKWNERVYISVIRSDDVDDPRVTQNPDGSFDIPKYLAKRSFRFRYDLRDAHTRKGEMERLKAVLTQLGLDEVDGLPVPERRLFRSRYGKTRARLEVDIAEWGIRTIMAKVLGEPETVRQAFVDSYTRIHGEAPDGFFSKKKVKRFMKGMDALARNDVPDRAAVLREMADDAGFDLTMIGALVQLAPRRTIRVQASVDGKRISYAAEHAGRGSALSIPTLHGH